MGSRQTIDAYVKGTDCEQCRGSGIDPGSHHDGSLACRWCDGSGLLIDHYRIVPRASARDLYRRRFPSRAQAEFALRSLSLRLRYTVAAYNTAGKRVDA